MPPARYEIYGLSVESEIELPELPPTEPSGALDVVIRRGVISGELLSGAMKPTGYVVGADGIYLHIPQVASYFVRDGAQITVDICKGAAPEDVRLFLLGSGMGALLHQLGLIPLHASAVHVNGSGVVFSADSGGGKSTVAALLLQHGYSVACDDVAALELSPGAEILMRAGVPRIRLPADSANLLDAEFQQELATDSTDRKLVFTGLEAARRRAVPLRRIYFLEAAEDPRSGVEFERLAPYEALIEIRRNIYRPSLIEALGRERSFFNWVRQALASVECYRLTRPWALHRAQEILSLLEAHLRTV